MKHPSRQILSVQEAFGEQGWHAQLMDEADVIQTAFEAHHTQVTLIAQAYVPLNALSITTECPMVIPSTHFSALMELLMRTNKTLNIGNLEYDLDRQRMIFRVSNVFEREVYDKDIVASMVHSAIAELDRFMPYGSTVLKTAPQLLPDLSIDRLLMREDFLPPVPAGEEEEEL